MTKYEELKKKLQRLTFSYDSAYALQHNLLAGYYEAVRYDDGVRVRNSSEAFSGALINRKSGGYGNVDLGQMNDSELLKIQSAIDDYLNRTKRDVDDLAAKLAAVEELLT